MLLECKAGSLLFSTLQVHKSIGTKHASGVLEKVLPLKGLLNSEYSQFLEKHLFPNGAGNPSPTAYFSIRGVCEMQQGKIDIRKLRNFASTELCADSALREILLTESEEIDVSTFLARLPIWLQLSKLERGRER